IGLSFDSGKSVIAPAGFSVLSKVREAIQVFPDSDLSVEGHTDSFGGDEFNLKLSQLRAESVRSYLLANMSLDPATITATGFGESKPIANNESKEGRVKNRRIDLVIKPSMRKEFGS
ncbi:MAG: OmpA family protein, partial [Pseudomonadales bacterium]